MTPSRDRVGRFAETSHSGPELTLDAPFAPGARVAFLGKPGHRIIGQDGDLFTLRPPQGGKILAKAGDLKASAETSDEQGRNLRDEAAIARLLVSVRKLSRQRREELSRRADGPAHTAAFQEVATLVRAGLLGPERYLYGMTATKDAPVLASHAALAILARDHLSGAHYDTLTAGARRAGATLPD